jgi:AcrR family transcriptional regulator
MTELESGPELGESRLRRRMLDAAQRLVEREGGLSVSVEHLTLDKVIKEAGASRTSVYRIWSNKDEFNLDLLCDLAGPSWQGTAAFDEATIKLARDIVAERMADLVTAEGRRRVLLEAIRRAALQNYNAVVKSTQWRTYVALTATVLSMSPLEIEAREKVLTALQEAEEVFVRRMARFYEDMGVILGLQLKPHVESYETIAAVGASVVEGLGLRQLLTSSVVNQPLSIEDDTGTTQEWHLAAVGFLGVFDQLVEPILEEEYSFPDALSSYLKRLSEREAELNAER